MSLLSNPFDPTREAALVTGAGNGIGRAIAQALVGEGVRTVFADIREGRVPAAPPPAPRPELARHVLAIGQAARHAMTCWRMHERRGAGSRISYTARRRLGAKPTMPLRWTKRRGTGCARSMLTPGFILRAN